MITPTTIVKDYEAEIIRLIPEVESALMTLRESTRGTVLTGAQLGAMITEAQHHHRDKLWKWLGTLPVTAREEVIRFALRAHRIVQRDPSLADPTQLTFALIGDAEPGDGDETASPQSSHGGEWVALIKNFQRDLIAVTKLQTTTPVSKWTPVMKDNIRRALAPLVELYKKIS